VGDVCRRRGRKLLTRAAGEASGLMRSAISSISRSTQVRAPHGIRCTSSISRLTGSLRRVSFRGPGRTARLSEEIVHNPCVHNPPPAKGDGVVAGSATKPRLARNLHVPCCHAAAVGRDSLLPNFSPYPGRAPHPRGGARRDLPARRTGGTSRPPAACPAPRRRARRRAGGPQ
jgi:hypothetical protein